MYLVPPGPITKYIFPVSITLILGTNKIRRDMTFPHKTAKTALIQFYPESACEQATVFVTADS